MAMWLYQMNQQDWAPHNYRLDIWENERWRWPVRRAVGVENQPVPGDKVVLFYAPAGGIEAGIYGWAIVLQWVEGDPRQIYFRPVAPSDHLKMYPWWDEEAKKLMDEIRGEVKQGTFWRVSDNLGPRIGKGMALWLSGRSPNAGVNV
jgi:hypothetical protein